jgi:hypothetical protein
MSAESPLPEPKPAEFKTRMDGRGGLILVRLVGEPHDGRELYMDELDLPEEIYTSPRADAFEWWPPPVKDVMDDSALAQGPAGPPVRYILRVPDDTREPVYVSATEAR